MPEDIQADKVIGKSVDSNRASQFETTETQSLIAKKGKKV